MAGTVASRAFFRQQREVRSQPREHEMRTRLAPADLRRNSNIVFSIQIQISDSRKLDGGAAEIHALDDVDTHVAPDGRGAETDVLEVPISEGAIYHDTARAHGKWGVVVAASTVQANTFEFDGMRSSS